MTTFINLYEGKTLIINSSDHIITDNNVITIIDSNNHFYIIKDHYEDYFNWAQKIKNYPNTFPHKIEFSYDEYNKPCAHIENIMGPLYIYYKIINETNEKIKYPLEILSDEILIKKSRNLLIDAKRLMKKKSSRKKLKTGNMDLYIKYLSSLVNAYDNRIIH